MKRILLTLLVLVTLLSACASPEAKYQKEYEAGLLFLSDGDYEEALLAFQAAIELLDNRAQAYVGLGDAYTGLAASIDQEDRDWKAAMDSAQTSYEGALALDKGDVAVYEKLAHILQARGQREQVISLLEKACAVTGDQGLQAALDDLNTELAVQQALSGIPYYGTLKNAL